MSGDLIRFSGVALDLHRAAQAGGADQQQLLNIARRAVGFDSAWWGLNSGLQLHTTHADNLPPTYTAEWEARKHQDPIAPRVIDAPERAHLMGPEQLSAAPEFAAFLRGHGIRHILCILCRQERLGLSAFLSLYRRDIGFAAQDGELLTALFPHMMDALGKSWRAAREGAAAGGAKTGLRALCQPDGLILSASNGFDDVLVERWPDWTGPFLPAELVAGFARPGWRRLGQHRLSWRPAGAMVTLQVQGLGPAQHLTQREADVAERYSRGQGHKAIAEAMSLSPLTVRHYIRNIYAKLHVSDKAALTRVLIEGTDDP